MIEMRILSSMPPLDPKLAKKMNGFANTKQALRDSLTVIQSTWIAATMGAVFLGMSRPIRDHAYAAAIGQPDAVRMPDGSELSGAIISTYEHTARIEQGYPAYDMKPGFLHGPKVRFDKDGKPYNIVPFRHATPKTQTSSGVFATQMGDALYAQAKKLKYKQGLSWTDINLIDIRKGTSYGRRLKNTTTGQKHATPIYANLTKTGAPGHSTYHTFRTVSENSPSKLWWHPGAPANPIMEAVALHTGPAVRQRIAAGVEADVMQAIFG